MLAQVVCRSCGYHRAWPTMAEALADARAIGGRAPATTDALPLKTTGIEHLGIMVPDVERIRARFDERRTRRTAFERSMLRLTGMDLKLEQYKKGEQFVRAIADRRGPAALARLRAAGTLTLLVEGGARVITSMLGAGLVDRLVVGIAPTIIGAGTEAVGTLGITTVADGIRLVDRSVYVLDDDMLLAWDVARCR